ncbi:MAG: hypothetical protein BYD32DRAFT_456899 [Podila humilis]|nr:MAG: hypothetical protein BYD32DRAFT_456899 [Podila humilis]
MVKAICSDCPFLKYPDVRGYQDKDNTYSWTSTSLERLECRITVPQPNEHNNLKYCRRVQCHVLDTLSRQVGLKELRRTCHRRSRTTNFQQLQQEQLLKIQSQQRQQFTPNAGYEATAAMKMNPRPRTGYFPKREFGGVALGGLGGQNGSPLSNGAMGPSGLGNQSPGLGGFDDVGGSGKRDSYSSRRQSMATAMGKRGAAPAAIQEEEE